MADIAMLVAEEYERRVRTETKLNLKMKEETTSSSMWGQMMNTHKLRLEAFKKVVLEPKSEISLAASYALFSA